MAGTCNNMYVVSLVGISVDSNVVIVDSSSSSNSGRGNMVVILNPQTSGFPGKVI